MPTVGTPYLSQYMSPIQGGGQQQSSGMSLGMGMGGGRAPQSGGMGNPSGGNPFNALLDPSRSGILGLVGRITGQPTREEWLLQKQGSAQQGVMSQLQASMKGGKTAQQAVMELIGSPQGMELFTSSGDPMGDIKKAMEMIVAPVADDYTLTPGDERRSGADNSVIASVPMGEVLTFTQKAEIAGLTDDEMQEMMQAQMTKDLSGDMTQQEAAIIRQVKRGALSPEVGDKWLSGQLQLQPVRNAFDEPAGYNLVDMTDPTNPVYIPLKSTAGATVRPGDPNHAPGISPGSTDEDIQKQKPGSYINPQDPGDIILGAGWGPTLLETVGNPAGSVIPGLTPENTNRRRNAIRAILMDAQQLRGASEARGFSQDVKFIEALVNKMGVFGNPLDQGQALLGWSDYLDKRAKLAAEATVNPETTAKERGDAQTDMEIIRIARANLPPVEAITKTMEEFRQSGNQFNDVYDAATGAEDAVKEKLNGGKPNPMTNASKDDSTLPEFKWDQPGEIAKAIRAGTLKVGDEVIIIKDGRRIRTPIGPGKGTK